MSSCLEWHFNKATIYIYETRNLANCHTIVLIYQMKSVQNFKIHLFCPTLICIMSVDKNHKNYICRKSIFWLLHTSKGHSEKQQQECEIFLKKKFWKMNLFIRIQLKKSFKVLLKIVISRNWSLPHLCLRIQIFFRTSWHPF